MKRSVLALVVMARVASAQEFAGGQLEVEAPYIDLLTFGPGEMLLERFGHAAICLRYHDPRNQTICFNYGVTSFEDGATALAWNFLRGTQEFWVEPAPFGTMFSAYQWEDRDIYRQTLPLAPVEARRIEDALWDSQDGRNRFYVYDHLFDNCATRLRDLIDRATGGKLAAHGDAPYPLTYRDLAIRGLAGEPDLVVLMDFAMGRAADVTPTTWQAMFHPDVLRAEVAARFGAAPELVYRRHGRPFPTDGGTRHRLPFLLVALGLAAPLAIVRFAPAARRRRWLDRLAIAWAAVPLALVGLVLWTVAIVSSIPSLRWNELVLVFVPVDAVLPFLGEVRRRRYARVRVAMIVLVSLLVAIGVFHQPIWVPLVIAFLPLVLLA